MGIALATRTGSILRHPVGSERTRALECEGSGMTTGQGSCSPNKKAGSWWSQHIGWRFLSTPAHSHAFISRAVINNKTKRSHHKAADRAKAAGQCSLCWKRAADSGRPTCKRCRDRAARNARDQRKAWAGAGLCSKCGARRPDPEYATCAVCRTTGRRNDHARRAQTIPST